MTIISAGANAVGKLPTAAGWQPALPREKPAVCKPPFIEFL
jgi:hypothetical protein